MPKRIITPEQKAKARARCIRKKAEYDVARKAHYLANKERIAETGREYRAKNKAKIAAQHREYYLANREMVVEKGKEYWKSLSPEEKARRNEDKKRWADANREHVREIQRANRQANRERYAGYVREHYKRNPGKQRERHLKSYDPAKHRERYANEPEFRMMRLLRSRLRNVLKAHKAQKSASTMKLAGCDLPTLIAHLEQQFKPGMTWQNHGFGPGKWNVDHIRPCASFDLTDPAQQRACFHYSNLQPLWHVENALKGDKIAA